MAPYFAERLIQAVLLLALTIFLGSLALIAVAIGRRIRRDADFKARDAFRDEFKTILEALLSRTEEYPAALERFQQMIRSPHAPAAEQVFLDLLGNPRYEGILQRAAEDLGLVETWQRRLGGDGGNERGHGKRAGKSAALRKLRFVTRARSAENLGRIHHKKSWQLLVNALHDPHPDVQAVALRSLGAIGEPRSFPALVEQLRVSVASATPKLSERALEAALARFSPAFAIQLLPLLENPHPRVRVVAAQILRDMLTAPSRAPANVDESKRREQMGPEIAEAVRAKLAGDENPDARAVAADLLSFFERDDEALQVLLRLCDDPEWFVRLHAVRALGRWRDAAFRRQLFARATDSNWWVREAALHALMRSGAEGTESVLDLFLSTRDAYAREQAAEELQVSGAALALTAHLGEPGYEKETQAASEIARMGKARSARSFSTVSETV